MSLCREEIIDVERLHSYERVEQRTVEGPMPQILKETVAPFELVQHRTSEHVSAFQILKQTVDPLEWNRFRDTLAYNDFVCRLRWCTLSAVAFLVPSLRSGTAQVTRAETRRARLLVVSGGLFSRESARRVCARCIFLCSGRVDVHADCQSVA